MLKVLKNPKHQKNIGIKLKKEMLCWNNPQCYSVLKQRREISTIRPCDLSESTNENLIYTNSFHWILSGTQFKSSANTGEQSGHLRAEEGVKLVTPASRQLVRGNLHSHAELHSDLELSHLKVISLLSLSLSLQGEQQPLRKH